MNVNIARTNMVQQQVRPWNVFDSRILNAMSIVPRERFVLPKFQHLAFSDAFVPIGHNQVTLPPAVAGRILQVLNITSEDRVLEIGTGTGYFTALISHLAKSVLSVEINPDLSMQAAELFKEIKELHSTKITLEISDAVYGKPSEPPFDVIVFTGSLPLLPKILLEQLKMDGRLFVVLGTFPMKATLITRAKNGWTETSLFETDIPPLINAPNLPQFQF